MRHPAAFRPALLILLFAVSTMGAPALHAQTSSPPREGQTERDPATRDPSMREMGAMMGQMMGQMGEMMGDMAQSMGSSMQRMMERMQREGGGLRDPKTEHIEGKLAFLRAELQITQSQEGAWNSFAESMRKAVAIKPVPREGRAAGLPEKLDDQARALESRLAMLQAKQAAVAKLYTQLDAKQKALADELIEQIGLV